MAKRMRFIFSGIWIAGVTYAVASYPRAWEMSPWPLIAGSCLLLTSLAAVIPTVVAMPSTGENDGKHLLRVFCAHAILPIVIMECWFLPEEISFRIMVHNKLEAGAEPYFERPRRPPFDEFYLMYDEGDFWVMD